jgi:hypothetical protein
VYKPEQDIWYIATDKPVLYRFIHDGGPNECGPVGFVYAFAPHYGHNVYLTARDVFATLEECQAEIARRKAIKDAAEDTFITRLMADLFPTA